MWASAKRCLSVTPAVGINKPIVKRHGFRVFKNRIPSIAEIPKERTTPLVRRKQTALHHRFKGTPRWYEEPWRVGPEHWDNPLSSGPDLILNPDSSSPAPIYSTHIARQRRLHHVELARQAVQALQLVHEAQILHEHSVGRPISASLSTSVAGQRPRETPILAPIRFRLLRRPFTASQRLSEWVASGVATTGSDDRTIHLFVFLSPCVYCAATERLAVDAKQWLAGKVPQSNCQGGGRRVVWELN